MARLLVRDEYAREFEIDASARPFWPRVEVIREIPDIGDEPIPEPTPAASEPPASGEPQTSKSKASRPASEAKE